MTLVTITYVNGTTEEVYADWVPAVKEGVLTLVGVNQRSDVVRSIPLTSMRHYDTKRVS